MSDSVALVPVSEAPPPSTWRYEDPIHRPSAYAVCEAVAFGRELAEIERDPSFPPKDLFLHWVMSDPPLALAFARAREMSAFALEDAALYLLRTKMENGKELTTAEIRAVDLYVQQVRWSATKRNPQVFSDKASVQVVVPIQINTSLDLGKGAESQGTSEFPKIYDLRSEVVQEVERPLDPETARVDVSTGELKPGKAPSRRKKELKPKARFAESVPQREARLIADRLFAEQNAARMRERTRRHSEARARQRAAVKAGAERSEAPESVASAEEQ